MIKIRLDKNIESVIYSKSGNEKIIKDRDFKLVGDIFSVINQFVGMATAIEFINGEIILISKGMFDNVISNTLFIHEL